MSKKKFNLYALGAKKEVFIYIFILGLLAFLAHYLYFTDFGLYFDDYLIFWRGWGTTYLGDCLRGLWAHWTSWPAGRPFQWNYGLSSSFIITKLAPFINELQFLYVLGFIFVCFNSILLFFLLSTSYPNKLAFLSALFYTLYTANGFKFYLTGSTWTLAINFILLSSLFYMRGRRVLSWLFFGLALGTYEIAILPSLVMPLLKEKKWGKALFQEAYRYYRVLFAIMLSYLLLRLFVFREARLVGALYDDLGGFFTKVFSSMLLGPMYSLKALFYHPFQALSEHDLSGFIVMLCVFAGLSFILYRLLFCSKTIQDPMIGPQRETPLSLLIAGLLLLPLSYVLNFHSGYPPALRGPVEMSRHFASAFAWSFILGALFWLLFEKLEKIQKRKIKQAYSILIALYFSLCIGYLQLFQKDAIRNWQMQEELRKAVVKLSPDISKDTVILWHSPRPYTTKYAGGMICFTYYLEYFYSFHEPPERVERLEGAEDLKKGILEKPTLAYRSWEKKPRIYSFNPKAMLATKQGILWKRNGPSAWEKLDLANTIFIYGPDAKGQWHRKKYIKLAGRNFSIKTSSKTPFDYKKNRSIPHQILLGKWKYPKEGEAPHLY